MINFETFKKSLREAGKNLSDDKLKILMDIQYKFANTVFDLWVNKANGVTETIKMETSIKIHKDNGNACTVEEFEFNFKYTKTYVR
ncbi:MAG: hypothetical protein NT155_04160 [Candidatus Staskawiczbacteria bacterium]|nr:hypothetical protein [Candidatus Staskawiczbacteria bacterium]